MINTKIIGTGVYLPGKPISNEEVKKLANVEFDSDRLENNTGIKYRHIARLRQIQETTADFAEKAAMNALSDARISADDIDLIIVATDTPEYISPATSLLLQGRLQKRQNKVMSFDVGSSCASFSVAFDTANRILYANETFKHALVVGVYNMPAYIREKDSFGWSIFADGAGAFVIGKEDIKPKSKDAEYSSSGYLDGEFVTDGTQWNFLGVYTGGTKKPVTHELLDKGTYGFELLQKMPGDRNIKLWPGIIESLCKRAGVALDSINCYVMTQINKSVILEVMKILGQPVEKAALTMDKYGYTGSACVPIAFNEMIKQNKVKRGNKVLFCASGAGLEVGTNLFIY